MLLSPEWHSGASRSTGAGLRPRGGWTLRTAHWEVVTTSPQPRDLQAWPCQSRCLWSATDEVLEVRVAPGKTAPLRVFACAGCGSEWVRSEGWTPADVSGEVPGAVRAELAAATARPDADVAGSEGT